MREELLKRLDEFVEYALDRLDDEYDPAGERKEWLKLRAELAAERCENCAHWSKTTTLGKTHGSYAECVVFEADTHCDDYCSDFGQKERS